METRISHRALKQSQNELRVCCGRCILFSASNPGSVHSLRQKLNPVSQEVSKPASAPAPTNKNANRLRTIVMKTQKQIRWSRQDVDNKVLSVRWHLRQKISLDHRGNSKQATGVTGGTVSSDPSLESLVRNSKKSPKQTNKVKRKKSAVPLPLVKGGRNPAALLDKRNFIQAATDGGCRQNKHVKFQSSAIPFSPVKRKVSKRGKGPGKAITNQWSCSTTGISFRQP